MQMIGSSKKPIKMANNGQLSLDKMDLDRKEQFAGDAFNPFGLSVGGASTINTQLQAQNAYIAKANTQGG